MARNVPLPYDPDQVPSQVEDLPRFLETELYRIATAMQANAVSFAIHHPVETVPIGTTPNWAVMFDDGTLPSWDFPGGDFDPNTGIWVCPQDGLYHMATQLEVAPFGSGNKMYYAGIRLHQERQSVSVNVWEAFDGGDDNIPLGVALTVLIPALQGDVFYTESTAVHENQTGTVEAKAGWQIIRTAG